MNKPAIQLKYPFQKQRAGCPATVFEKVGPFTLKVSNKGFYEVYEVAVTGGVVIIKQASRPGLKDICNALRHACGSEAVSYEVYDKYMTGVNEFLAQQNQPTVAKRGKRAIRK